MRRLALLLVASAWALLAGCGAAGSASDEEASLLLDFTPNAVHTGIYAASARGFDTGEGVRLRIRVPSSSTDAARLLASGRVDFAVLDIHDLALARERGRDLVGVMAIVQRPLASVIAVPGTRSPRALEGRRVGVTGAPSDQAVLRSVVAGAGGRPARVHTVTIGFEAVPALLARRVAGATAFWNVEGVALRRRRPGFEIFRVDDYAAPSYPELVVCTSRATLRERPHVVDGVVRALRRGYRQVLDDPEGGVADLTARVGGLDRRELEAQLAAVQSAFLAPDGRIGELDPRRLRAWARWEVRFGIVRRPPDVRRAFRLGG
jgi:putative hydroxymethylpyrimidine transport system substrate-binding protein